MPLPVYEIHVAEGTTYRLALRPMVEDDDGVRTPFDLTGVTFALRVETRDAVNDIGSVTVDGGLVHLLFTADETAALTHEARSYYGIDMHLANGDVRRILEGPITVRRLGAMVIRA